MSSTQASGSVSAKNLTERSAWKALTEHCQAVRGLHLRQLFAHDSHRGERLTVEAASIYLDYAKNRITDETIRLLMELAAECGLSQRIEAMFTGERINVTEKRAVLHIALRAPEGARIIVDGIDVVREVRAVLNRMAVFSRQVRGGEWRATPASRSVTSSASVSAAPTWVL